jgi:hypothetical protein
MMANDKISESKDSFVRDLVAVIFVVVGISMMTTGLQWWLGWTGVLVIYGAALTFLGVVMGITRTGKE